MIKLKKLLMGCKICKQPGSYFSFLINQYYPTQRSTVKFEAKICVDFSFLNLQNLTADLEVRLNKLTSITFIMRFV